MLCVLIYAKLFANCCIIPTLRADNFMFNGKLNYVPGIKVSYKNGCPYKAKYYCYLGPGEPTARYLQLLTY